MRCLFGIGLLFAASSVVSAADFDGGAAPLDIDPKRFGWTGFYAGVSAGYGWLEDVDYAPVPPFIAPLYDKGDDWVFGGHAGYLHQFGNFVVGAEAEALRLDITYEGFDFITIDNAYVLKARGGYAFDRLLVSGNVGAVYAATNYMGLKDWGWAAGAGVDYAVSDRITVGLHYDHFNFSEFDGTQIDATIDLVTARVGYKF